MGILATEFVWARNLLNKVKTKLQKAKGGNSYGKKTERIGRGVHGKNGV